MEKIHDTSYHHTSGEPKLVQFKNGLTICNRPFAIMM